MRSAMCLLLFGCGRVGFVAGAADDAHGAGDGVIGMIGDGVVVDQQGQQAGPDGSLCTALAQFSYNFDGTGAALWMPYNDPGYALAESGNQLVITLPNSRAGTAGYFSTCKYDLHGQRVFVTAPVVPRLGTKTDMYLAVGSQGNTFGINVTSGNTQAYRINGANYTTFASVPYDATNHKVWQIREAGGLVYYEVSPDGISFTNLYSGAPPFDVSAVQLLLFADEFTPITNPGSAEFAKLDL